MDRGALHKPVLPILVFLPIEAGFLSNPSWPILGVIGVGPNRPSSPSETHLAHLGFFGPSKLALFKTLAGLTWMSQASVPVGHRALHEPILVFLPIEDGSLQNPIGPNFEFTSVVGSQARPASLPVLPCEPFLLHGREHQRPPAIAISVAKLTGHLLDVELDFLF